MSDQRRWIMFLALAAGVLSGLLVGEARAKPRPLFGFNDDLAVQLEHRAFASSLGANAVRVPIGWSVEPESFAAANAQLRAAGQRPIINLMGPERPPVDAYARQAVAWALAYPQSPIQLWNEPNHRLFGNLGAQATAAFIAPAIRAIRTAAPDTRIIGPAIVPSPDLNHRRYQSALYKRLPDSIGVGLHVFVYSKHPMADVKEYFRGARKHGKVWVTEAGFFGNIYGPDQPFVSAQGYRKLAKLGAKAVIFHRLAPIAKPTRWERAASMSVLDDPALAAALKRARSR